MHVGSENRPAEVAMPFKLVASSDRDVHGSARTDAETSLMPSSSHQPSFQNLFGSLPLMPSGGQNINSSSAAMSDARRRLTGCLAAAISSSAASTCGAARWETSKSRKNTIHHPQPGWTPPSPPSSIHWQTMSHTLCLV